MNITNMAAVKLLR